MSRSVRCREPGRSGRVALVTLGGTIATVCDSAPEPALDGTTLCGLARVSMDDITVVDLRRARGSRLSVEDVEATLETVQGLVDDPAVAAVVVTTGSVTLEELAFLLAIGVPERKPVVVTGAMRNADEDGWDGGRNLRDAVAAVREPGLQQAGVMVGFGGELHSALLAEKVARGDTVAFDSPVMGPLAVVEEHAVVVRWGPIAVDGLGRACVTRGEVPIWYVGVADSGAVLRLASHAVDGLVLVGFPHLGLGLTAPVLAVARELLGRGVLVAYTSRFARVCRQDVLREEPRLLVSSHLSPAKVRLALMAAPTADAPKRLQALFERIDEAVNQVAGESEAPVTLTGA